MPRLKVTVPQVEVLPRTHEATIPEDYLDMMGHMNVMWYTHLFSCAMGGIFQAVGMDAEYMRATNSGSFALEAHIRYLSEVREGHHVEVFSRLIDRSAKRMHVLHLMVNREKHDIAATFEAVATHIDMSIRRSSPYPAEISGRIDGLLGEHSRLDWEPPLCGGMSV